MSLKCTSSLSKSTQTRREKRLYNMLYFILENDNPVGDGDTISGLENGELDSNVQWTLQYEDSLVQPVRAVLDVNMGEYASGTR